MAGIYNDSIGGAGGFGFGMGGYGAGGIFEGLILGALLGNRGFGLDGRDNKDCCCTKMIDMHDHHNDHDHTIDAINDLGGTLSNIALEMQECCCDTQAAILNTKYDLGVNILESKFDLDKDILINRYENALQGKDIIREIDLQSCGINRNIDEVKFNQAIFAKDAAAQLAACCCTLENKIRDSIDATNKCCCEQTALALKIDAKNDMAFAERERRDLERKIDCLLADKRDRDGRDEQNILNNFGTITDSLNKVITALGNTAS